MANSEAAMLKEHMQDGEALMTDGGVDYRQWLVERRHYSFYFIALYLIFVFGGQAIMRRRKPLPVSSLFLLWNIFLAVFSLAGTVSVLPEFIDKLTKRGFFASYCEISDSFYAGSIGYWVYLFHFSKLLELGDTIFLVLRKRPVIFLHWYHHITVLAYTWYTYDQNIGATRWGVMMNYFVHAMMYTYYAVKSARLPCPKLVAPIITTSQIVQFMIGICICIHQVYLLTSQGTQACNTTPSVATAIVLYTSYFILFVKFFYDSYIDKSSSSNKFTTTANGKKTD